MDYRNKVILAPMVRMGTLPIRLLSLDYGADLVYGEEIVDRRMLSTTRVENGVLDTIDFVSDTDRSVVFRTCAKEKKHVVFQIGTASAELALQAALKVQNDVAAIDINMGCPKDFSIKGGMGAALLTEPDKIRDILTTLVKNLSIPVTCKIRIFENVENTLKLCKMIQSCGVAALAVHGRRKEERSEEDNHDDVIKLIAETLDIPVIANGGSNDIESFGDIEKFRTRTGSSSVMVARAAQWNCSVFRREGPLPVDDVIQAYLKYVIDYDSMIGNVKYCLQSILGSRQNTPIGAKLLSSQTLKEVCQIWGMESYYQERQELFRAKLTENGLHMSSRGVKLSDEPVFKKLKLSINLEGNVKIAPVIFHKAEVKNKPTLLPKNILISWTRKKGKEQPLYRTESMEKLFMSCVTVDGCIYASSVGSINKRYAEQAAAQVCLDYLGITPDLKEP